MESKNTYIKVSLKVLLIFSEFPVHFSPNECFRLSPVTQIKWRTVALNWTCSTHGRGRRVYCILTGKPQRPECRWQDLLRQIFYGQFLNSESDRNGKGCGDTSSIKKSRKLLNRLWAVSCSVQLVRYIQCITPWVRPLRAFPYHRDSYVRLHIVEASFSFEEDCTA